MSNDQQDVPPDDRAGKAANKARKEAIIAAKARQEAEDKKLRLAKAAETKTRDAKWEDERKLAETLQCPSKYQLKATSRLTGKTTEQLGAMIRAAAATKGQMILWVSVTKPIARDVMQRAYPLGLQMGIMGTPNEQHHYIRYHNGSCINFTWPDKPAIPVDVEKPH